MTDYPWTCHVCKAINGPGSQSCTACGFPAVATGTEIEAQLSGTRREPIPRRKEFLKERRREIAAMPFWKKPIAYLLRFAQFVGAVILWSGIFNLSGSEIVLGLAVAFLAEAIYQVLKGKANGQENANLS